MTTSAIDDPEDQGTGPAVGHDRGLILDIEGFEGPLDLLLALARDQRVDLKQISVVQLADQYLDYIAELRRADLELAAEYLVMAAWLAYLKSRLLLPVPPEADAPSGEELAAALAWQLRHLEAIRTVSTRLMARPRLGIHMFARTVAPEFRPVEQVVWRADLHALLRAYGACLYRQREPEPFQVTLDEVDTLEDALERIRLGIGQAPGWESLYRYLPPGLRDGLRAGTLPARAALAATFAASLELARQGVIALRQQQPFSTLYVRAQDPAGAADGVPPAKDGDRDL